MTPAATRPAVSPAPSRALHLALWALQVLLGLAFLAAGVMKSFTPLAELGTKMPWVPDVPGALVRFIGVSELAGGLGLILPAATRIKPGLTALAGAALTLVMVLAGGFHLMRGEAQALPINLVMGALLGFIAWGRWKKAPIAPR